ncbi:MAG: low molecular weight protein arginine phosphatase, partial [Clostridia bacterium]|nr:low molecular weight protein arginine phosphatase [Clostridia bacterium]MBR2973646.1 low molecular weight protein arginine phosphatase [Clostridia bacterium]MBR2973821.1 low molecular weight protein arginine phosphatase [Clostridia bacterium]
TMTAAHKSYLIANGFSSAKVFTLAEMAGETGDISDPYGLDLDEYKKTAAEINELVQKIRL